MPSIWPLLYTDTAQAIQRYSANTRHGLPFFLRVASAECLGRWTSSVTHSSPHHHLHSRTRKKKKSYRAKDLRERAQLGILLIYVTVQHSVWAPPLNRAGEKRLTTTRFFLSLYFLALFKRRLCRQRKASTNKRKKAQKKR